jgi:5,10-methylenetetrahydromethanopterin reductase
MTRFLGFGIAPFASAGETLHLARVAEAAGLHSFWLGEGYHGRSATALLAALATTTKRLVLGTSVVSIYTRHPALLAMEAATIDELSGGRFVLGVGVNVSALVKHGVIPQPTASTAAQPLAAMRDSLTILRGLLQGERITHDGKVFRLAAPGSRLDFHGFRPVRPHLPLYVGSRSPRILQLCGELADGVVLSRSLSTSERYVGHCIREIATGAARAGRKMEDLVIAANLNLSVDTDAVAARELIRPVVALYMADPNLDASELMVAHTDLQAADLHAVREAARIGGITAAAQAVTPAMIDTFAIAGRPSECVEALLRLQGAGVQMPIAFDVLGPNPVTAIRLIAQEIVPTLTQDAAAP